MRLFGFYGCLFSRPGLLSPVETRSSLEGGVTQLTSLIWNDLTDRTISIAKGWTITFTMKGFKLLITETLIGALKSDRIETPLLYVVTL